MSYLRVINRKLFVEEDKGAKKVPIKDRLNYLKEHGYAAGLMEKLATKSDVSSHYSPIT